MADKDVAAAAGPSGRDQPGTSSMPFDTQDEPFLDVERSDFQLLKRVCLLVPTTAAQRWNPWVC